MMLMGQILHIEEGDKVLSRVRMFRNYTQGYLFEKAINEFMDNYDSIMNGTYKKELLDSHKDFVHYLKKDVTGKYCFSCHEVLALELVGDKVIKTLLDVFVSALTESNVKELENSALFQGKIYSLISSNFKYIALHDYNRNCQMKLKDIGVYDKLRLVVDFISGMTDSYAVNLYKELTGISLPQ
ncbi:hypothetical protein E5329_06185 [Petralouisia muris]|uniref:Uncharacterized protein n=1 Tax=Petralouisia muris TaxID=3032872 RepID=A0AC61S0B2_9FIRM|nr:hypothetical protein [Petralouisia muris]TGY97253.1 hypothetical protein E5329_06185 [Petralouisia muris]